MGPILYTTDFSDNSIAAMKMAHSLSKKLNSQLILLHVFDLKVALVTPLSVTYAKMEKEAFEKYHKKLQEFYTMHLGEEPESSTKFEVRENAIINDAIVETINEYGASMVVMGLKGKSAFREVLMGSSTKGMIDKSPCPVLAIPEPMEKYTFKKITYATDFEETDIQAMDWLVHKLAKPLDSFINILHVGTADEYAGEDQMQWFEEMLGQKVSYPKMDFRLVRSEDIFGTLLSQVEELDTDLVVMLEREKSSFLGFLTREDLVKRMMSKGNFPILSMNKANL
ncbi:universal stress protein [Flagellimonas nanhaiensis]|uniref:UspA domain-containing protein n=1 Tax=Flagellimonas nanhaiensis TaxID=2292706 RepID=A0A371JLU0_9FLAO|nr:universal stress protein [Allomuricauda nanhaiensis]RDY58029.1 hypothetical protein DX873_15975 [Allomuricauda nanhaiensis]